MESFIRRDSEFQMLYNCSFYNVSDIPLEQRVNFPIGAFVFYYFVHRRGNLFHLKKFHKYKRNKIIFQQILYVPCKVNEIRELILKLVCIDISRLSHQTQAEVRHISGMERNETNNEEMLELQVVSA